MSQPRVLHLSTARTWRGGEQQLAYLVEELASLGVEQCVVCAAGSAMESKCEHLGVERHTMRMLGSFDPSGAHRLARFAKLWQADLLHTHDSHGHSKAVLANTLFGMNLPLVVARRVDFPISSGLSARWKYGHPSVKRILCVSKAIKAITARGLKDPSVLHTVYSGIDLARFKDGPDGRLRTELGLAANLPLVGNVAALAPHKDLFTFIRMAKRLAAKLQEVHFVLVGKGALRAELEAFNEAQGLTGKLTFLGFRNDVERLLPELDVLVMTSRTEGLGTSILDAFAAGVPVVATAAGGIPELVDDGDSGLLCTVADDAALAAAAERVLDDRTLRRELVRGATRKLQGFTKKAMAQGTLKQYQDMLSELRGAANTNSA